MWTDERIDDAMRRIDERFDGIDRRLDRIEGGMLEGFAAVRQDIGGIQRDLLHSAIVLAVAFLALASALVTVLATR